MDKKHKRMVALMQGIATGKGRLATVALALASVSMALMGCGKKVNEGADTQSAVLVKEMTVGAEAHGGNDFDYSGTVEEETGTALSFSVNGTIQQLNVKVGDRVRKGQLVAAIDPTSVRNSYEISHANRQQAEDVYKRYKQLYDKGSLPEIRWVEVQSKLQEAVSAENIARKNLHDCKLLAPYDGVIAEKTAEVGQNVAPGTPIARLVTTHILNVKVAVPESEVANVALHQEALVRVKALGGRAFKGRVVEKSVVADPISRSYTIKIRLEETGKDLLPGMVSEVRLMAESLSQAIVIPAQVIQLGDDGSNFVWLDEGGKAVRRAIVCGTYQSDGVVVTNGLKHGDRLIVEGQQKVCNGTRVAEK